ncbi:MAG: site-specific integrase [Bacteroidales bacterium]|nr:site-specific integrase [Bacteroidales bacterium]
MIFFQPIPHLQYRECRLSQGKEWFVYFYVQNPSTGKLKRVRIKVNSIHPISARKRVARELMTSLNQRLALGWNPLLEAVAPKASVSISEAMDTFLNVKAKEIEPTSMRSYRSYVKLFGQWMARNNVDPETPVSSMGKEVAMAVMDDIEGNMTAKSFNNYLTFFRNLFNWMKSKGYTMTNPFDDIQKKAKRLTVKQRRTFSEEEMAKLWAYLMGVGAARLAMCMICYACLIRPKEIVMLKCADVDLERNLIHIDSKVAKNDHESFRTIPADLARVLKMLDLSDPDNYLFSRSPGRDFSPGPVKEDSREIARWWNDHVRPACGFGKDLQFYSLKDTGITDMLGDGIPINLVQQQADHSSVAMTAIYVGRQPQSDSRIREVDIIKNDSSNHK